MSQGRRLVIAVIGAGAKAAALAAKAFVLRQQKLADIHVTIFENKEIGAHWSGKNGYTDGKQRLCTPGERDLGFPYSSMYGAQVDQQLHAEFSWASFLLSQPLKYGSWIDGGRKAPAHEDFARYLSWAIRKSKAAVVKAEVAGLKAVTPQRWAIQCRGPGNRLRPASAIEFDGVVVSGPGPAKRVRLSGTTTRVFDGADFWLKRKQARKILNARGARDEIAIVGAGGTAAATLAWLTQNGYKDRHIVMIADQAALFTRGDSVFENRLFRDDNAWQALSIESREQFFNRLNRGVVWGTVMEQVSSASNLVFLNGRASRVKADDEGLIELTVKRGDGRKVDIRPEILIDASGFNPWWFLRLIRAIPGGKIDRAFTEELQTSMADGLNFSGASWPFPRLHAPVVSSKIGPGYGSLMSLGSMSDRIFRTYDA